MVNTFIIISAFFRLLRIVFLSFVFYGFHVIKTETAFQAGAVFVIQFLLFVTIASSIEKGMQASTYFSSYDVGNKNE